jgi:hypothetical protein
MCILHVQLSEITIASSIKIHVFYDIAFLCLCIVFLMDDSVYINCKSMSVKSAWSLNGKSVKV